MQTKKNIWTAGLMICLLLLSGIGFTSCDKDEVDDTIVLNSFGPSPALRGGELRFIGNNLKNVTSIVLPGLTAGSTIEVTEITVVNEREIRIMIPQTAGVGTVTLKTPQGDITTKTPITYSEPISIESVSPATIKAGQTLTIKGDYLNLIKRIIFFDGVALGDTAFTSKTRKQIELKVPVQAQTGKIILSNGAEIPIEVYSKEVLNVVLPTFTSFAPTTIKPGAVLTITGKDLDLVDMVEFGGGKIIPSNNFSLNTAGTEIKVNVPEDAQDGILKLLAKSGVAVEGGTPLTTVMPSGLTVTPEQVKNDKEITIKGANLDLVSAVKFGDLEAVISSKAADKIVLTVPKTATALKATLVTLSTKTIETPAFTYIKPAITALNPTTLMAGSDLTIEGTNLDLVKQVKFPSAAKIVDVTPASAASFVVAVPTDATSGNPTLITVNGTEVESTISLTVTAADIPVVTSIPATIKPGKLLAIKGTKLNLVKSVIFDNNVEATNFETRSATLLEVYVPAGAKSGLNNIKLVTYSGKIATTSVTISGTDPITAETKMIYDFNQRTSDWHAVDWDNWGGSYDAALGKANGYITLFSRPGWWVLGCNHADPNGGWPSVNPANYVLKIDMKTAKPILITGGYEFIFKIGGENVSSQLLVSGNYIATPDNDWATLTIPISGVFSNPTKNSGDFGIILNYSDGGTDFAGLSFDNLRFDPK